MRGVGMLFQETKVIQHRMVGGEIQLADHPDGVMPGLHPGELDALVGMKQFAAGKPGEKIEMPPRAAEFAIGGEPQAGRGLFVHDLLDLHVLDLAEIVGRNFALLESGACFLDAWRPQQAADFVGAEGAFVLCMVFTPGITIFRRIQQLKSVIASQRIARMRAR